MTIDNLRRLFVFLLLCLAQVLVLSRIQLYHCATPMLYVYFVIIFPRHYPRWSILLWSFFMGLMIDAFENTPGVTAASLTLTGFLQPYLLEPLLPREAEEDIKVSASSLGFWRFAAFAAILILIHCMVFFSLETFTFAGWSHWLPCVGGSALLTFVLLMAMERLRK